MVSIAGNKRRYCEHTLDVKYAALMEIKQGVANKTFPKNSMPQKTLCGKRTGTKF